MAVEVLVERWMDFLTSSFFSLPSFPKSNTTNSLEVLQQVPCRSCTCIFGQQLLIIPPPFVCLDFSGFCIELASNYLSVHAAAFVALHPKGIF